MGLNINIALIVFLLYDFLKSENRKKNLNKPEKTFVDFQPANSD